MEATRRGFLKTAIGTSLLGLFLPEKLKLSQVVMPPPKKEDTPHMPSTPLPEQPAAPFVDLREPVGAPAPHEHSGAHCPFTGQAYSTAACPCDECNAARRLYWEQVKRAAEMQRGYSSPYTSYQYGGTLTTSQPLPPPYREYAAGWLPSQHATTYSQWAQSLRNMQRQGALVGAMADATKQGDS